jgi:microcystin degradation protein MlrC
MECGSGVSVGASVLLDIDGVHVIVTSAVGAANDPGFFTLHGIDLAAVRLLCVKAKNHFRAAFLPLTQAIIDVDCPGPAAADLSTLPRRSC